MSLVKNKDANACAAMSRQFAGAMKKADPGIVRIHCASFDMPDWAAVTLKEIAESADFPELVQDGWYLDFDAGSEHGRRGQGTDRGDRAETAQVAAKPRSGGQGKKTGGDDILRMERHSGIARAMSSAASLRRGY